MRRVAVLQAGDQILARDGTDEAAVVVGPTHAGFELDGRVVVGERLVVLMLGEVCVAAIVVSDGIVGICLERFVEIGDRLVVPAFLRKEGGAIGKRLRVARGDF